MKNDSLSILFLGKEDDKFCEKASCFVKTISKNSDVFLGKWGDPFPDRINSWQGDYVISYLSRWIIPNSILSRARKAAINFHPASPEYPGIGCINFALYEESEYYGVTCHHMSEKVDRGDIIAVKKFPIFTSDSVKTLLDRTYNTQIELFYEIMDIIIKEKEMPKSSRRWARKPFTRKEFDELFIITKEMNSEEVKKRTRAVSYRHWKPKFV